MDKRDPIPGSEEIEGFINFKSGGDMNGNGKIWRDGNGVCHIEAENKSDAYRLMGYAHGRDRGMQLLMMRILGQGRASEILDSSDELLGVDTFFRRMNWYSLISKEVDGPTRKPFLDTRVQQIAETKAVHDPAKKTTAFLPSGTNFWQRPFILPGILKNMAPVLSAFGKNSMS